MASSSTLLLTTHQHTASRFHCHHRAGRIGWVELGTIIVASRSKNHHRSRTSLAAAASVTTRQSWRRGGNNNNPSPQSSHQRTSVWVPRAYRGWVPTSSPAYNNKNNNNHEHDHHPHPSSPLGKHHRGGRGAGGGGGGESKSSYNRHNNTNPNKSHSSSSPSSSQQQQQQQQLVERQKSRERQRLVRAAREKAQELWHWHSQCVQAAETYRRHFQPSHHNGNSNTTTTSTTTTTNSTTTPCDDQGTSPPPPPLLLRRSSNSSSRTTPTSSSSATTTTTSPSHHNTTSSSRLDSVPVLLQQQIPAALRDVHEAELPVRSVDASEADFRILCQKLQAMTIAAAVHTTPLSSSSSLATTTAAAAAAYADLAECCLRQLVILGRDRALLAEAARTYGQQQYRHNPSGGDQPEESFRRSHNDSNSGGGVAGWFRKVVDGIFHLPRTVVVHNHEEDHPSGGSNEGLPSPTQYAHEDLQWLLPPRLVRSVLLSIAAAAHHPAATATAPPPPPMEQQQLPPLRDNNNKQNDDERDSARNCNNNVSRDEAAAHRIMDLWDSLPPQWTPDVESLRIVLAILGRAGTLDCARLGHQLYLEHGELQYGVPFATVLEAYRQACRREQQQQPQQHRVDLIANEAWTLVRQEWDRALPKHRVERILQCSIVLHCLSMAVSTVAARDDDEKMMVQSRHRANALAKAALSGDGWTQLWQEMRSATPKVDAQTLPMVNYLAQLYAAGTTTTTTTTTTINNSPVENARRMLHYMMHHGREGVGRFMVVPDAETCNVVLKALLERNCSSVVPTTAMKTSTGDAGSATIITDNAIDATTTVDATTSTPTTTDDDDNDEKEEATASNAAGSTKISNTLESDFAFAQRVLAYMHRRKEVECWPNATTYHLLFAFLDRAQPAKLGAVAEEWLSWMEAKHFLSRDNLQHHQQHNSNIPYSNSGGSAGTNIIKLSTYHSVLQYLLKEAQMAAATTGVESKNQCDNSNNAEATNQSTSSNIDGIDTLPCVRALRLLDRLVVQSTPWVLSETWMRERLPDLCDPDLKPQRSTIRYVLQICAATTTDREIAAAVALDVYQRCLPQVASDHHPTPELDSLLMQCAVTLPETSETRQDIEDYLAYRNEGRTAPLGESRNATVSEDEQVIGLETA